MTFETFDLTSPAKCDVGEYSALGKVSGVLPPNSMSVALAGGHMHEMHDVIVRCFSPWVAPRSASAALVRNVCSFLTIAFMLGPMRGWP